MADQEFVFGAKMDLRGPTPADLAIITKQINSGLRGASASISIKTDKSNVAYQKQIRDLETLHKNIRKVGVSAKSSSEDIEEFGRRIGIAGKRYLAFSVATVGVVRALGALRSGLKDALEFEREIVKIGQVSGRSLKQLSGLRDEILSTGAAFGVSSDEIASAAVTLAQTGRPLKEIRKDLEAITKASLAPTFGDAKDTVEGLIAVQNQFGRSAGSTIEVLSKLNAVAGQFPVESSDLITAVKKTGGAFRAAGGDLDELLSLFTSVRSTTRESADTIGTAFRTITGRLGRIKTIDFFKDVLNVDLLKDGKILAPFQAIEKIVEGLNKKGLLTDAGKKSPLFSSIVEELGGIRQRAKVIPLLTEFAKAQEVLNVSQGAGTSITQDAAKAQQSLGVQVVKVKQEFQKFVDNVLKDPAFRKFATGLLDISRALIRIADAARPLIPLAGTLAGFFALRTALPLARGILPTVPKIKKFADGGSPNKKVFDGVGKVPGVGIRDSVPALIKPDEFVVKSQAHHKYGTKVLHAINEGRLPANFADGIVKFASGGTPGPNRKKTTEEILEEIRNSNIPSGSRVSARAASRDDSLAERQRKTQRILERVRRGNTSNTPVPRQSPRGITEDDLIEADLFFGDRRSQQRNTRTIIETVRQSANRTKRATGLRSSERSVARGGSGDDQRAAELFFEEQTRNIIEKIRNSSIPGGSRKSKARTGGTQEDKKELDLFIEDRKKERLEHTKDIIKYIRSSAPRTGIKSAPRRIGTEDDQRELELFLQEREDARSKDFRRLGAGEGFRNGKSNRVSKSTGKVIPFVATGLLRPPAKPPVR